MRISCCSSDVCSSDLLGFGKGGFFDRGPHHRLGAAIELVAFGEFHQLAHDGRFGVEIHRQIRVVPIAADAEALQLLALGIHPLLGIGPAFGTKFLDRNLVLRSEEHTSELQSLMRISYAVFCLKKKTRPNKTSRHHTYK